MTDKNKEPDLNLITEADLRDDERLSILFVQALRAGFWPCNSGTDVLTFWSLAEKALAEDKKGTPGRLFYSLVKAKDFSKITNKHEERAMGRVSSAYRNELYSRCKNIKPVQPKLPLIDPEEVSNQLYGRNIAFHHGVMVQCFMPQQRLEDDFWQTDHGKATLAIEAGRAPDPDEPNRWVKQMVPFGTKARIIMPYIVGYAVQHNTPVVDMGKSLRRFFESIGMSAGGAQGKEITQQVHNIASATIRLGTWTDTHVRASTVPIADEYAFWLEKEGSQQGFWQPEMTLGTRFFEALKEHRVPVDMEHLVSLGRTARRQDLYVWFSYRLPRLKKPLNMPLSTLQAIFGQTITDPYAFKQKLKGDLRAIGKVYDGFHLELKRDYLEMRPSKSPVPHNVTKLIP